VVRGGLGGEKKKTWVAIREPQRVGREPSSEEEKVGGDLVGTTWNGIGTPGKEAVWESRLDIQQGKKMDASGTGTISGEKAVWIKPHIRFIRGENPP